MGQGHPRGVLGLGSPGLGLGPAGLRRFLAAAPACTPKNAPMIVPTTVVTEPTTAVTSEAVLKSDTATPNTIPSTANAATISPAPYLILAMSTLEAGFWTGACS
jgi:hypothetical protein